MSVSQMVLTKECWIQNDDLSNYIATCLANGIQLLFDPPNADGLIMVIGTRGTQEWACMGSDLEQCTLAIMEYYDVDPSNC